MKRRFNILSDPRFRLVRDETYGSYLLGEHITGDYYFMIGHHGTANRTR